MTKTIDKTRNQSNELRNTAQISESARKHTGSQSAIGSGVSGSSGVKRATSLHVEGLSDRVGNRYFKFGAGPGATLITLRRWNEDPGAINMIATHNGIALTPPLKNDLRKRIGSITSWPEREVATKVGWTGSCYVFGDGNVVSPGAGICEVAFPLEKGGWTAAGSLRDWTALVELLKGQELARFAVFSAFAGPLLELSGLPDNVGIEFYGPTSTGKSSLQRLMSSVWGEADGDSPFWTTWLTTINGLERTMERRSDSVMILDEFNLFGTGSSASQHQLDARSVIFSLSSGSNKARLGDGEAPSRKRFVWSTSSNQPSREAIGYSGDEKIQAALARLISIPANGAHGVFERLPAGVGSGAELVERLRSATVVCHGVAGRKFIERLVADRANDEAGLTKRIVDAIVRFKGRVRCGDGKDDRVASNFGLVMAAGELAQDYGLLPPSWKAMIPVRAIYNRCRKLRPPDPEISTLDTLRSFANARKHIAATSDRRKEMLNPSSSWRAAIRRNGRGNRELLVRSKNMKQRLPGLDLPRLYGLKVLVGERGSSRNLTTKRRFHRTGPVERVYCFDLGQLEGQLLLKGLKPLAHKSPDGSKSEKRGK